MSNLLSSVRGMLTDNVVGKVATLIGSNSSMTKAAISKLLPSLLGGITKMGSSKQGASSLLNLLKNHKLGSGTLNNLTSSLSGGGATDSLMDKGEKLNEAIFGGDLKNVIGSTGLDSGSASKLMNIATPLALGSLGKVVQDKNLDASGLQSYLKSQSLSVVDSGTTHKAAASVERKAVQRSSGGGIMKWLIPLFLLLAAAWFFMQDRNGNVGMTEAKEVVTTPSSRGTDATASTTTTQAAATHTHADGTTHSGAAHGDAATTDAAQSVVDAGKNAAQSAAGKMGVTVDGAGNLVDRNGKILYNKGEFMIKDGEYFDMNGKKLNLLEKLGKVVGDAGKAVGGAVAGAAGKTADAFKDVFGGMFKKKSSGEAVAAYGLSDIVFDTESHKITSFSKNEVQGLAAALKATPDAKIKVQVSSADGADKGVTKKRAQVVHDMLVTLGVADKQISAEGMGAGDGKVSIVVE